MTRWLTREAPSALLLAGGVVVAVGLASGLQRLVRRALRQQGDVEHNDVAGALIAVIGAVFAVVAGFVVVGSWEGFEDARRSAQTEAAVLGDVIDDAAIAGDEHSGRVRAAALAYAAEMVDVEWPAMARGGESRRAGELLAELRTLVMARAAGGGEALLLEAQLDDVRRVGELRRVRLAANEEGLPHQLWLVLLASGGLTVGFGSLFGLRDQRVQHVMLGSIAAMVAITVVVVAMLDYPFAGDLSVRPAGFAELIAEAGAARPG